MMSYYTKCAIAICTIVLIQSHVSGALAQSNAPRATTDPSPAVRPSSSPSATLSSTPQSSANLRSRDSIAPTPSGSGVSAEIANQRDALTSERSEKVRELSKKMTTRLEAAQSRQENLLGRIDSRIGKLKDLKVNTAALDKQVASLEQMLTQQAALIAAITPNLDKALSDASSTQYFNSFKESVNKAVAQITTTQGAINKLFEDLKSLSIRISPSPVSSVSPRIVPSASVTSTLRPSPSPRSSAEE
jgi:hypothetical protein